MLKAEASANWDAGTMPRRASTVAIAPIGSCPTEPAGGSKCRSYRGERSSVARHQARNVPYNDRATNEFHVDVFDKGQLVKQFDGKFDGFSPDPVTRTFDIGMKADKVRLTVKSFYVSGGGFAEVSVATSTPDAVMMNGSGQRLVVEGRTSNVKRLPRLGIVARSSGPRPSTFDRAHGGGGATPDRSGSCVSRY